MPTKKQETLSETLNRVHADDMRIKANTLKQKMAKAVSGSAPSLIPAGMPGGAPILPPAREEEVIPSITDLIPSGEEQVLLQALVSKQIELNAIIKPLEAQKEYVVTRIKAILGTHGVTKALCDGASINYFRTERKTINATKLIAYGVAEEVITASTDVSVSATLKITKVS